MCAWGNKEDNYRFLNLINKYVPVVKMPIIIQTRPAVKFLFTRKTPPNTIKKPSALRYSHHAFFIGLI